MDLLRLVVSIRSRLGEAGERGALLAPIGAKWFQSAPALVRRENGMGGFSLF